MKYNPILKTCIMGYNGNHAISHNQNGFSFEEHTFVCVYVAKVNHLASIRNAPMFSVGLINPWATGLSNGFALILSFP